MKYHIIYPGIEKYMNDHDYNIRVMAIHCKIPYTTMNWNLTGRAVPSKITIDAILKATGMTYEEAFGEDDTVDHG